MHRNAFCQNWLIIKKKNSERNINNKSSTMSHERSICIHCAHSPINTGWTEIECKSWEWALKLAVPVVASLPIKVFINKHDSTSKSNFLNNSMLIRATKSPSHPPQLRLAALLFNYLFCCEYLYSSLFSYCFWSLSVTIISCFPIFLVNI